MNASNPKEPIKNIREPGGPIPPPNGPTTHPNRQARDPLSVFSLQFLIHQLDILIVRWMAENRTRYHESLSCLLNNTVPEVRPTDSESPNGGRFRRHTTPLSGIPRQLWIATWNYNYKEGILRGCNFLVSNYWSVCSWMRSFLCSIFIHVMLLSFLDDRSFFDYRSWFYSSENYHEGLLRYAPKIALLEALFIALYLVLACLLDFTVLMIWKLRLWRIDFNLEELLENYYKGSDITREQNIKLIIQTLQLFGLENVDRKMVRKVLANPEYSDENIHDVAGIFANSYCLAPGKKKRRRMVYAYRSMEVFHRQRSSNKRLLPIGVQSFAGFSEEVATVVSGQMDKVSYRSLLGRTDFGPTFLCYSGRLEIVGGSCKGA